MITRRRPGRPDQRDYHLAWGPADSPVEDLVLVPGSRWRVEEAIKLGKSACGLADYEVRSWHGWYRHITLAQLAAAFLTVHDVRTAAEIDAGQAALHLDSASPGAHTGGHHRPRQPQPAKQAPGHPSTAPNLRQPQRSTTERLS
ncbi:hypothetical protein Aple_063210 [Acrocarpospora pleiomorpha]|uniref:Uncharacterized protein n=1 Tax=Acrocarpospora pleiomorpha TaxID=90975 RepID=A0A5M3XQW3_9ACTN|nr:hypothetical protein [Acrocarpospora pleiomorpha]GES23422.1 hypothetical protein Aple_063210 [Acrocarpospora pleiomorpha]